MMFEPMSVHARIGSCLAVELVRDSSRARFMNRDHDDLLVVAGTGELRSVRRIIRSSRTNSSHAGVNTDKPIKTARREIKFLIPSSRLS